MKWNVISIIFLLWKLASGSESKNCGGPTIHGPKVMSLIAGGREFESSEWPFMAALFNDLVFICGGTISEIFE
jgi:hypothetical protein